MSTEAANINQIVSTTFDSGRRGIRAQLPEGASRTEFEWRRSDPGLYQHETGGELWVGFRLRVPFPGANASASLFQFGPVRDVDMRTASIGYYQLQIARATAGAPHTWRWRGYAAVSQWNAGTAGTPEEAVIYRIGSQRIASDNALGRTWSLNQVAFNTTEEFVWVAHLKMRDDSTGLIRLWGNGRLLVELRAPNAFPLDFTRVKWGPYVGMTNTATALISAEYTHISIAENGGEDGYRTVAPGVYQTVPADKQFSKTVSLSAGATAAGANTVLVTGLPFGWSFFPGTREIRGTTSPLTEGARLLIRFLTPAGSEFERVVWIFPGDPTKTTADLDNDGVANKLEEALGSSKHSAASGPAPLTITSNPLNGRSRLTFVRALADATYAIEAASSLESPASWTPQVTNPGRVGGTVTWEDPQSLPSPSGSRRFYRLRVTVP